MRPSTRSLKARRSSSRRSCQNPRFTMRTTRATTSRCYSSQRGRSRKGARATWPRLSPRRGRSPLKRRGHVLRAGEVVAGGLEEVLEVDAPVDVERVRNAARRADELVHDRDQVAGLEATGRVDGVAAGGA